MRFTSAYVHQPALAPGAWNDMGGNYQMQAKAGRWFPAANLPYPIALRYAQRTRAYGLFQHADQMGALEDTKVTDENDYTPLYIGGAVIAAGIVYLLVRKK